MKKFYSHYISRSVMLTALSGIGLAVFLFLYVYDNPVFGPSTYVPLETKLLTAQEKRNIETMNYSFDQLMSMGDEALSEGDLSEAEQYYFYAKSLFPTRLEPRKNLCYTYIKSCPLNRTSCQKAKKEIYFAHQYLENSDQEDRVYLAELARIMGIDDIVHLSEPDAMRQIY